MADIDYSVIQATSIVINKGALGLILTRRNFALIALQLGVLVGKLDRASQT